MRSFEKIVVVDKAAENHTCQVAKHQKAHSDRPEVVVVLRLWMDRMMLAESGGCYSFAAEPLTSERCISGCRMDHQSLESAQSPWF